jgi:hypothetical protein
MLKQKSQKQKRGYRARISWRPRRTTGFHARATDRWGLQPFKDHGFQVEIVGVEEVPDQELEKLVKKYFTVIKTSNSSGTRVVSVRDRPKSKYSLGKDYTVEVYDPDVNFSQTLETLRSIQLRKKASQLKNSPTRHPHFHVWKSNVLGHSVK